MSSGKGQVDEQGRPKGHQGITLRENEGEMDPQRDFGNQKPSNDGETKTILYSRVYDIKVENHNVRERGDYDSEMAWQRD